MHGNKVAIVTGASQGIGKSIVTAYLNKGYSVVATSRSIEPHDSDNLIAIPGDISSAETVDRVIDATLKKFRRIDTLVNNAGVFLTKPFTEFNSDDWNKNISTNLGGFFYITQRAIDQMKQQHGGHVIQITTSLVDQPIKGVPSVLASLTKGGLNAATRSLAIEYADAGIRVNAVSPGIIRTPMHQQETHDFFNALHPIGRMGEIEDIVNAIIFLEDSPYITGEILHVDGGQSAGRW
ncbi:SDR family oxidoreductase [Morganella psychrotolerans]|uniref:SDR family oxidoreductase n=1 Tax=Morganella psychrotolerans TaxID=368603 RepID=A0A5M9R970_9GAMM|nr:SDR family oxidoreductase [Morganella psychrotolerans]KAA8717103.1 SDR family oxidoreductase [Morganella psychrotolerans]OBU08586.1 3-oxoacyl-ACP reductase [Morganella psychrotolerans]